MRAMILLALLTGGCAFIDPVWEFRTGAESGLDAGLDASQPAGDGGTDGSAPGDAGHDAYVEPGDAGPAGPEVCRPCTFASDEGCPQGYGCYLGIVAGETCSICLERTGLDADLGEACSGGPDCRQGIDCIAGRCRTFCNSSEECAADEACAIGRVGDPTGWCLGVDCDPADPETCGAGQTCALTGSAIDTRVMSLCVPAGAGAVGGPCTAGCPVSSTCVGSICVRYCAPAPCDATEACVQIATLTDGTVAAACLPRCTTTADCPEAEDAWTCDADELICVPRP